jgi:hypothetical protein
MTAFVGNVSRKTRSLDLAVNAEIEKFLRFFEVSSLSGSNEQMWSGVAMYKQTCMASLRRWNERILLPALVVVWVWV